MKPAHLSQAENPPAVFPMNRPTPFFTLPQHLRRGLHDLRQEGGRKQFIFNQVRAIGSVGFKHHFLPGRAAERLFGLL